MIYDLGDLKVESFAKVGALKRTNIEMDYLTVNSKLYNFNPRNNRDRNTIRNYLEQFGLKQTTSGLDWVRYSSEDGGIRAEFTKYPSNNRALPERPSLKIDYKGHFFIHQNSVLVARKITLWFLKKFGAFPSISRVDLRQDVFNVTSPFDFFPDFSDSSKYHWALRSEPDVNYYTDGFKKKISGFSVRTSRYDFTAYDRIIALRKKLKRGECSQAYYDHYIKKYDSTTGVQRLEVRLKHDACKIFQLLFLHKSFEEDTTFKYVLANFGRNHVIKDVQNKFKVNPVFSELFYLEEKEDFKYFRQILEEETEIKLADMVFKKEGRSQAEISRMFAKKLCQTNSPLIINMFLNHTKEIPDMILNELTTYVEEFKEIENDRIRRYKLSLAAFELTEEEMLEARKAIITPENLAEAFPFLQAS